MTQVDFSTIQVHSQWPKMTYFKPTTGFLMPTGFLKWPQETILDRWSSLEANLTLDDRNDLLESEINDERRVICHTRFRWPIYFPILSDESISDFDSLFLSLCSLAPKCKSPNSGTHIKGCAEDLSHSKNNNKQ